MLKRWALFGMLAVYISGSEYVGAQNSVASCGVPPVAVVSATNLFNEQQEMWLGQVEADLSEADMKNVRDLALSEHLQAIADRLLATLPPTKIKFTVKLIESSQVNAFSFAGGHIYVQRKLAAIAENDDYANGRPCLNRRANATDVANGAGGDLTNNAPPSPVGGHEEYATDVTPAQLTAKGYDAFSILGHADGYHNTSLFMQPHFNLMDGGGYQVHFDMFNPHAGAAGLGLHGVVDLGIGSLFFKHSTVLDPGC